MLCGYHLTRDVHSSAATLFASLLSFLTAQASTASSQHGDLEHSERRCKQPSAQCAFYRSIVFYLFKSDYIDKGADEEQMRHLFKS
jgi:hypothetical protein